MKNVTKKTKKIPYLLVLLLLSCLPTLAQNGVTVKAQKKRGKQILRKNLQELYPLFALLFGL